jgi:hypothetical protein
VRVRVRDRYQNASSPSFFFVFLFFSLSLTLTPISNFAPALVPVFTSLSHATLSSSPPPIFLLFRRGLYLVKALEVPDFPIFVEFWELGLGLGAWARSDRGLWELWSHELGTSFDSAARSVADRSERSISVCNLIFVLFVFLVVLFLFRLTLLILSNCFQVLIFRRMRRLRLSL